MVLTLEQQRLMEALPSLPPPHQSPHQIPHFTALPPPGETGGVSGELGNLTETLCGKQGVCTHHFIHSFTHSFHSRAPRPQAGAGPTEME